MDEPLLEEALTARFLEATAITTIAGAHFFWQSRPPGANSLPAITAQVAADIRAYNHDAPDEMQEVRIQFDCRALTYLQAKQLARAVLFEMEQEKEQDNVMFHEGRKVSGSDAPKETLAGGTEVYRITMDIMVQFRATA